MTRPPEEPDRHAREVAHSAGEYEPIGWPTQIPLGVGWWRSVSDGLDSRGSARDIPTSIEAALYVHDGSWSFAARLPHEFSDNMDDENVYRLVQTGWGVSAWKVTQPGSAAPYLQVQVLASPESSRRASRSVAEARSFLGAVEQVLDLVRQVSEGAGDDRLLP